MERMKRMKQRASDERGAALIWAVILFMMVVILSTSVLFLLTQDSKETVDQEDRLKAYYVANSGIEIGYAALMTVVNAGTGEKYIDTFPAGSGTKSYTQDVKDDTGTKVGAASVTLSNVLVDGKRWIQLRSVGTLEGSGTQVTTSLRIDSSNHEVMVREQFGK